MAIKKTINGAAPIMTTKIKAPITKKTVVGVKKNDETIKPATEEAVEIIEEVESVSVENPTPFIPEIDIPEPLLDMPIVYIPERRFEVAEKAAKLAKERKFAKIALCLGILFLVLMILNKK